MADQPSSEFMQSDDVYEIVKEPEKKGLGVALFSIVKNESYFIPHLLDHYRKLGINEFWFLDDGSSDGTLEILQQQKDCGILQSQYTFADRIDGKRFVVAMKNRIPSELLSGRWVLTVDADEFLVLPSKYSDITHLVKHLIAGKIYAVRALLVDFFPEKLEDIGAFNSEDSPFQVCNLFNRIGGLKWPDGKAAPEAINLSDGVRANMFRELKKKGLGDFDSSYRHASLNKVPLVFWGKGVKVMSSHRCNLRLSDKNQLVLAHFKFFPGYEKKIADAKNSKAYWNNSIEYQFLDQAIRELSNWPLRSENTRCFTGPVDLEAEGLIW